MWGEKSKMRAQEHFVSSFGSPVDPAIFLQSSEWEEFQRALGRVTWRANGALIVRHDQPYGFNYLYAPRPEYADEKFLLEAREIGISQKSVFLKIDPVKINTIIGARPAHALQAQKSAVLGLLPTDEELLSAMHGKTRYNIRLAERSRVSVSQEGNFQEFWDLLQETAVRDGFYAHPREHYEKLLAIRTQNFSNELFFARHGSNLLAAAMVNFYAPSRTAVYLHGASLREKREFMAPHLLHWRIIEEARRREMKAYDFGGIDEIRWSGLTRFKMGFGASSHIYPQTVDVPYRSTLYALYRMARRKK